MTAPQRPVTEIQIGGTTYRVQSSADAAELARLVQIVDARLATLSGQRRNDSRSLVLVALSLAHDLEQLRAEHASLRADVSERLTRLVGRIDRALDHRDEHGDPLPPLPALLTLPADAPLATDAALHANDADTAHALEANAALSGEHDTAHGALDANAAPRAHDGNANTAHDALDAGALPRSHGAAAAAPGANLPLAVTRVDVALAQTPRVSAPAVATPTPPDVSPPSPQTPRPPVRPEPVLAPRRTPTPRPRGSTKQST